MQVLRWMRRPEALAPAGVVTAGAVSARLLAQLRTADPAALARLTVVATRDMLVLLGAREELPWVDGARYCAPDPQVQTLWLPTTMQPREPAELVRRSAGARAGPAAVLLWNDPEQFLPLDGARSLTTAVVDWLVRESA